MKEVIISLLEPTEKGRVLTDSLIRNTLKSLIDNKLISISSQQKACYTEEENHVVTPLYFKLEDCGDKFMGAFLTWFAYGQHASFHKIEDGIYKREGKWFNVCLSSIRDLCCMLHRIKGIEEQEGFNGKIYLKICDENDKIEPLAKHAKYFNEFSELNLYDF